MQTVKRKTSDHSVSCREQPMHVMEKSGFLDKVGRENVCAHIDDALERASKLQVSVKNYHFS